MFSEIQKFKDGLKLFWKYWAYTKPYWKFIALSFVLTQIVAVLGLVGPYLSKLVVDDAFANRDFELFILLSILIALVFLLIQLINSINTYVSQEVNRKILYDLQGDVVTRVYQKPLKFFKDSPYAESMFKIQNDISSVANLITDVVPTVIKIISNFVLTFIIVATLNLEMGIMAFVLGIVFYFHTVFFTKHRKKLNRQMISQRQSIFKRMNDSLSKMYFVKASGKEQFELKVYLECLLDLMGTFFRDVKVQILSSFSGTLLNEMVIGALAFYGGYNIIMGNMTLGVLTAIMLYLGRISGVHGQVGQIYQTTSLGLISCERLDNLMRGEEKEILEGEKIDNLETIKFEDVSFAYEDEKYVLKNFNAIIEKNKWIALVGRSGCGKSTAISLLLGLFEPQKGKVFVNGIDLKEIDKISLREKTGVVLQEPNLFNTTIRDNITYLNKNADEKEINEILKLVHMDKIIETLPQGLDTNLGDDACKFSQGQKQRLALARALLREPQLLVMDEALSQIDYFTEAKILSAVKEKYPKMTVIVVMHNKEMLALTDNVVFMQKDYRYVLGGHKDLISTNKEYNELFSIK